MFVIHMVRTRSKMFRVFVYSCKYGQLPDEKDGSRRRRRRRLVQWWRFNKLIYYLQYAAACISLPLRSFGGILTGNAESTAPLSGVKFWKNSASCSAFEQQIFATDMRPAIKSHFHVQTSDSRDKLSSFFHWCLNGEFRYAIVRDVKSNYENV